MTRKATHFSTLHVVLQEIENVLNNYPKHPYQSAFLIPELHQKLITQILKYSPLCNNSEEEKTSFHHPLSLDHRLKIQLIVRASVLHIIRENPECFNRRILTLNKESRNHTLNRL